MKVRVNNIPEKKPLPFWIVTRKFAIEEFSEIAEKLKHSWIPFPEPLMYSNIHREYHNISLGAKVLYSFMLNRTLDWTKNPFHECKQFYNENDEVYISFPLEEAVDLLQYGIAKSKKCYEELIQLGMIEKKNNANEFYVLCNDDMLKYKHINVD